VIAFVGSVFSPYYAWARARRRVLGSADAEDHCALNVALYGAGHRRWTMTERGRRHIQRDASEFRIGPSRVRWDGRALEIDIDEVSVPVPRHVLGRVRVLPTALCRWSTALDVAGRHRWGPIAPCARIEVDFARPGLRWEGHAYVDSNEGDEPLAQAFRAWDWSRARLSDGGTAVIYDVRTRRDGERVIAQRFAPDGSAQPFDAPAPARLPRSAWAMPRRMSSLTPPRLLATLEDTPFYVRSTVQADILGETVTAVHESLDLPRVASLPVRMMLPFRMPRRG
jgi:carotenoid 1,2-hydratase